MSMSTKSKRSSAQGKKSVRPELTGAAYLHSLGLSVGREEELHVWMSAPTTTPEMLERACLQVVCSDCKDAREQELHTVLLETQEKARREGVPCRLTIEDLRVLRDEHDQHVAAGTHDTIEEAVARQNSFVATKLVEIDEGEKLRNKVLASSSSQAFLREVLECMVALDLVGTDNNDNDANCFEQIQNAWARWCGRRLHTEDEVRAAAAEK